ncbi:hypothetical protein VTO42DRAFT_109 [Malbranchea cinnamomea]
MLGGACVRRGHDGTVSSSSVLLFCPVLSGTSGGMSCTPLRPWQTGVCTIRPRLRMRRYCWYFLRYGVLRGTQLGMILETMKREHENHHGWTITVPWPTRALVLTGADRRVGKRSSTRNSPRHGTDHPAIPQPTPPCARLGWPTNPSIHTFVRL